MSAVKLFFATLIFMAASIYVPAQSIYLPPYAAPPTNYNECAAILFNGNLLVDDFSPTGKCKIEPGMTGTITVASVKLSDGKGVPIKNIGFKVAIKNSRTNTLWMYSDKTLQELKFDDIFLKCERGDQIIIMTVDPQFSLTHHEIIVGSGGC